MLLSLAPVVINAIARNGAVHSARKVGLFAAHCLEAQLFVLNVCVAIVFDLACVSVHKDSRVRHAASASQDIQDRTVIDVCCLVHFRCHFSLLFYWLCTR
jgi:hypothetical protein